MQQDFLINSLLLLPLYHLFTLVVLVRNIQWMHPKEWGKLEHLTANNAFSICIPARNEAYSIAACLNSLLEATKNAPVTIWVLDDNSEDNTSAIVTDIALNNPKVNLIKGKVLPDGWRGKNWACFQLASQVTTDYMVFIDADVIINNALLLRLEHAFSSNKTIGMVSFWPEQQLQTSLQGIIIPWVYRALLTHLPSIYQYKRPLWMPTFFYNKFKFLFAAANGQCIAFRKETYFKIGGHNSVKNEIVEDICLSKKMLSQGYSTQILSGKGAISCRMYETNQQMFEGFRKNFFVGFGKNTLLFIVAALFHWVMFLLPFLLIFYTPFRAIAISSILMAILTDFILKWHFKWPKWTVIAHPFGVLWFTNLAVKCLKDHFTNTSANWKGRKL